jgi:hypothetical protein
MRVYQMTDSLDVDLLAEPWATGGTGRPADIDTISEPGCARNLRHTIVNASVPVIF